MHFNVTKLEKRVTGEVADGDGNAGNGSETEVIEGVEIANDFGERRVSIYNWVLWFGRSCYVCVHL